MGYAYLEIFTGCLVMIFGLLVVNKVPKPVRIFVVLLIVGGGFYMFAGAVHGSIILMKGIMGG